MILDIAGIKYVIHYEEEEKKRDVSFGVKKSATLLVPSPGRYDGT
jgi:hypothetical protein